MKKELESKTTRIIELEQKLKLQEHQLSKRKAEHGPITVNNITYNGPVIKTKTVKITNNFTRIEYNPSFDMSRALYLAATCDIEKMLYLLGLVLKAKTINGITVEEAMKAGDRSATTFVVDIADRVLSRVNKMPSSVSVEEMKENITEYKNIVQSGEIPEITDV